MHMRNGSGRVNRRADHAAVKLRNRRQASSPAAEGFPATRCASGCSDLISTIEPPTSSGSNTPDRQHVTVKHRQQHRHPVRFDGLQHDPAALDVVQQVAVRQHRAFRPAGRAGGVDDDGQA